MIIVAFIVAAIVANRYMPPNTRTILMVMTNIPTVVGFAMVAWCKSSGARLAGYCAYITSFLSRSLFI